MSNVTDINKKKEPKDEIVWECKNCKTQHFFIHKTGPECVRCNTRWLWKDLFPE